MQQRGAGSCVTPDPRTLVACALARLHVSRQPGQRASVPASPSLSVPAVPRQPSASSRRPKSEQTSPARSAAATLAQPGQRRPAHARHARHARHTLTLREPSCTLCTSRAARAAHSTAHAIACTPHFRPMARERRPPVAPVARPPAARRLAVAVPYDARCSAMQRSSTSTRTAWCLVSHVCVAGRHGRAHDRVRALRAVASGAWCNQCHVEPSSARGSRTHRCCLLLATGCRPSAAPCITAQLHRWHPGTLARWHPGTWAGHPWPHIRVPRRKQLCLSLGPATQSRRLVAGSSQARRRPRCPSHVFGSSVGSFRLVSFRLASPPRVPCRAAGSTQPQRAHALSTSARTGVPGCRRPAAA